MGGWMDREFLSVSCWFCFFGKPWLRQYGICVTEDLHRVSFDSGTVNKMGRDMTFADFCFRSEEAFIQWFLIPGTAIKCGCLLTGLLSCWCRAENDKQTNKQNKKNNEACEVGMTWFGDVRSLTPRVSVVVKAVGPSSCQHQHPEDA